MLNLGLVLLGSGLALAGVSEVPGGSAASPSVPAAPVVAPKSLYHQLQEAKAESTGGGAVSQDEMSRAMSKLSTAIGTHNAAVEQVTGIKSESLRPTSDAARAPASVPQPQRTVPGDRQLTPEEEAALRQLQQQTERLREALKQGFEELD